MKLKRFINWKSYFSEEQVNKYNLKNTNIIKLYNTNDFNMPGVYQINNMNKYLGELVMMYYIWKNNLKSEYICISQYRKDFCNIDKTFSYKSSFHKISINRYANIILQFMHFVKVYSFLCRKRCSCTLDCVHEH